MMILKSANIIILMVLFTILCGLGSMALAGGNNHFAVPEASVYILAPVGAAAIFAAERHRRKNAKSHVGVGMPYFVVKRTIDISLAAIILLATLPIFLLIALIVRLDSRGPILFKRKVIGKNGKRFDMYKFRSMVEGAEEILEADEELKKEYYINAKLKFDPRITRVGKFLRKTSLDELPQLINVLMGNMTFVGPRPIAPDEIDLYGPNFENFVKVTPGITGLWQTCGRSDMDYSERVKMDMLYIQKRSILLDLWILLYTIPAVLLRRGAY